MNRNFFNRNALLAVCVSILTVSVSCNGGNQNAGTGQQESTAIVSGQEVASKDSVAGKAELKLVDDAFNFGTVKEGKLVTHEFMFTNTGDAPLILADVTASCGCTTPEYSKHPILPGEQGSVKVVFNSQGQVGNTHKIVTLRSNSAQEFQLLHIRGKVEK